MSNDLKPEYKLMRDEILSLKDSLDKLSDICHQLREDSLLRTKHLQDLTDENQRLMSKVDEMYNVFNNGKFLTKVVIGLFTITMSLGGLYAMVKSLISPNNG